MVSETKTRFEPPVTIEPDKNHSSIGPKQESGFVENKEMADTLTGVPGERWLYQDRATGNTVYKDKFPQYAFAHVNFYSTDLIRFFCFTHLNFHI